MRADCAFVIRGFREGLRKPRAPGVGEGGEEVSWKGRFRESILFWTDETVEVGRGRGGAWKKRSDGNGSGVGDGRIVDEDGSAFSEAISSSMTME